MKRSSTLLANDSKKEEIKEKIKMMYFSSDGDEKNAPYYDPHDIHIHRWVIGRMDNPQDHHEQFIQMNNRYSFNRDVIYCSICHEINYENPFPMKNGVNIIENICNDKELQIKNDYSNYNKYSKELQIKNGLMKIVKKNLERKTDSQLFMNNPFSEDKNEEWVRLI